MITENVSTLKIHKLSQAQYDRELAVGNIDENALYLTPDTSPDWNVNDETASDFIKNRPFYTTDPVETTLVEETAITLQNGIGQLTSIQPLEVGQEYTITLDGTTYNCVAKMHIETGQSYIGNAKLVNAGEDTGEPFFVAHMGAPKSSIPQNSILGIMINSDVLEHTVGITGMISEVHKLDEKYIPDSLKESINKKSGLKVEGKTFNIYNPESGNYEEVVALNGAEIFNDYENIAIGDYSHAEGRDTIASGNYSSHAEGFYTTASGSFGSHAEGYNTTASGRASHVEGDGSTASEWGSHAEGGSTTASGKYSHAEGVRTIASGEGQHAQGRWSIEDTANKYAHIVGNGTQSKRSNAHTLDWSGNAWYQGDVYVGGTSQDDGKKLATEEYVDTSVANLVDSAPEDLNTLNELATAMKENSDVVEVLNNAINNKADKPTANDALALLMEVGMIDPIVDTDESIYIEDENMIYTF